MHGARGPLGPSTVGLKGPPLAKTPKGGYTHGMVEPKKSFYEPMSGAVILGVDWLAFGIDAPTGFALVAFVSAAAFGSVFYAVEKIQLRAGDPPRAARVKALLGATAAGAPFPVTGTIMGTVILAMSGLGALRKLR